MAFEPSVNDAPVGHVLPDSNRGPDAQTAAAPAVGQGSNQPAHSSVGRLETCPTKYRLRFRKSGDLRLVSHIDLMHCFERMLRRAALPFASTQGFHPKPKMVFAQALALGVVGANEVVEIGLDATLPAEEVVARLNRHAPPGIAFLSGKTVERRVTAQVRRAFYRLALAEPVSDLPQRCTALLRQPQCVVTRLRPQRRCFDLKPYVAELEATACELTVALWVTPNGAARPEEVARALGLAEQLEAGAIVERTDLEIVDEQPENERWLPDIPRLIDAAKLQDESGESCAPDDPNIPQGRDTRGMPHALIPNPLSFDT
jgi:radical SAM-linked protein